MKMIEDYATIFSNIEVSLINTTRILSHNQRYPGVGASWWNTTIWALFWSAKMDDFLCWPCMDPLGKHIRVMSKPKKDKNTSSAPRIVMILPWGEYQTINTLPPKKAAVNFQPRVDHHVFIPAIIPKSHPKWVVYGGIIPEIISFLGRFSMTLNDIAPCRPTYVAEWCGTDFEDSLQSSWTMGNSQKIYPSVFKCGNEQYIHW